VNDIHVYFIQTYEKKISHDYYCQIVTHEVCDDETNNNYVKARSSNQKRKNNNQMQEVTMQKQKIVVEGKK
jgi:hypothetical protein